MQLIVLGMHRSGTSMLMRLLNLMGAYFGPEGITTGANAENPRGFWERRDVRSLNDALLWSMGCDWNRISTLNLAKVPAQSLSAFRKKAGRLVLEMDAHRPWALKEPRLCLLLPLWQPLLEVPVVIHIHRHPVEVASSLEKRNGISRELGLKLWEHYVVSAHRHAANIPSVAVSHRRLVDDPLGTVRFLHGALVALGVQGLRSPSEREVAMFVSPDLYRERASRSDLQGLGSVREMRLFETLEAGEPSEAIASWNIESSSATALAAYEATLPPLPKEGPGSAPSTADQVKRLEGDIAFLRNITTKFVSDLTDRDERLRVLERELRTVREDLKTLGEGSPDYDRRIAELQAQISAKEAQASLQDGDRDDRDARIRALESELREAEAAEKRLALELAKRDQSIRSLEACLRAAAEDATRRGKDISQRDDRIVELKELSAAAEQRLQRQDAELTRLRVLNETLQASTDRLQSELAAREGFANHQERELAAARASIDGQQQQLSGYLASVDRLTREVQNLEAALNAAEVKVADRFRETEQLTRMLMEKEDEARALLRELSVLKAAIERRDERIATLESLQGERDALSHECRQLGERVKWLRDRLQSFETSTSWRATAPLRSLARAFRGGHGLGHQEKADLELIKASALFDAAWYVGTYADIGESGQDPATHYLLQGGFEGRNPGPGFDSRRYLSLHPDVATSGVNPLLHYLRFGQSEGRSLQGGVTINQRRSNG